MTLTTDQLSKELKTLHKSAALAVVWLALLTAGTIFAGIALLATDKPANQGVPHSATDKPTNVTLIGVLLCVVGGTLGSSVSALVSVGGRISNGWEFSDGTKYPKDEAKDKFVMKMVPLFWVRPLLGSAMGLLIYVGLKGGFLIAVPNAGQSSFSLEALLFLAFLGGIFAKTFLEKLRAMFDALMGKSAA